MANATEDFRCGVFRTCRALNDPTTPLEEQAGPVAGAYHPSGTVAWVLEPGWFVKLRELSVTFFLPDSWAGAIGASRASLVLTSRNLATWTDYTGLDPETNSSGGSNFTRFDLGGQPAVRFFSVRFNLSL